MLYFVHRRNTFVDVDNMVNEGRSVHCYCWSTRAPPSSSIINTFNSQHAEFSIYILLDKYVRCIGWHDVFMKFYVKLWCFAPFECFSTTTSKVFFKVRDGLYEKVIYSFLDVFNFIWDQDFERSKTRSESHSFHCWLFLIIFSYSPWSSPFFRLDKLSLLWSCLWFTVLRKFYEMGRFWVF